MVFGGVMRYVSALYQGGPVEEPGRGRGRHGGKGVKGEVEAMVKGRVE